MRRRLGRRCWSNSWAQRALAAILGEAFDCEEVAVSSKLCLARSCMCAYREGGLCLKTFHPQSQSRSVERTCLLLLSSRSRARSRSVLTPLDLDVQSDADYTLSRLFCCTKDPWNHNHADKTPTTVVLGEGDRPGIDRCKLLKV